MATQKTQRGIKYADRLGAVVRVGKDLFQSDFTTFQQALDELTSEGGTIVVGPGTFTVTAQLDFPAAPVAIKGNGRGSTIIDIASAAITLFGLDSDQEYSFSDFSVTGDAAVAQVVVDQGAGANITKRVLFERVDNGSSLSASDGIRQFVSSSSGNTFEQFVIRDCDLLGGSPTTAGTFFTAGASTLLMERVRLTGANSLAGTPRVLWSDSIFTDATTGSGWTAGADSVIMGCTFTGGVASVLTVGDRSKIIGGTFSGAATATSVALGNRCILQGTTFNTTGVGTQHAGIVGVANCVVSGCEFQGTVTSNILITGGQNVISGNEFRGATTQALSITSTNNLVSANRNCKVVESGGANLNRYRDIDAVNSVIIGVSSVVNGAKSGKYTGDGATSQLITLGFQPRYVRIWREELVDGTNSVVFETTTDIVADNAAGGAIFIDNNDVDFETNRIITLGATGFTVDDNGADEDPNTSGQVYNFWAVE